VLRRGSRRVPWCAVGAVEDGEYAPCDDALGPLAFAADVGYQGAEFGYFVAEAVDEPGVGGSAA
jgi:hypothetical protein